MFYPSLLVTASILVSWKHQVCSPFLNPHLDDGPLFGSFIPLMFHVMILLFIDKNLPFPAPSNSPSLQPIPILLCLLIHHNITHPCLRYHPSFLSHSPIT
uniref:Putative ovule protein n=1 Tax=Solanum chacoense TaxID=4108 RepID=A0A0V0HD46_SOLCH